MIKFKNLVWNWKKIKLIIKNFKQINSFFKIKTK